MVKNYTDIFGWADDEVTKLYDIAIEKANDGDIFVELGAYEGRSTCYMVDAIKSSNKNITFYVIDTWLYKCIKEESGKENWYTLDKNDNEVYEKFCNNLGQERVKTIKILRMDSMEASKLFSDNSIKMVFLDTNHNYEYVLDEINHWYPKVKDQGIISGHDIHHEGVYKAVMEKFNKYHKIKSTVPLNFSQIIYYNSCWYNIKN